MLRMILQEEPGGERALALHGRLTDDIVAVVEAECRRHLATTARLLLDLDGVSYIDGSGLSLLRRWRERGLAVRGGSPFVRALLAVERLEPSD